MTVTATDGAGNSSTAEFNVTVTGAVAAPVFSALTPGAPWTSQLRPVIGGQVNSAGADFNSLFVEVERIDILPVAALSGLLPEVHAAGLVPGSTEPDFTLSVPYDFEEGSYRVQATIGNVEGAEASATWSFSTDFGAPSAARIMPAEATPERQPAFLFEFSDARSGIDLSSAQLSIDGLDVTQFCVLMDGQLSYLPEELDYARHAVVFEVRDVAGNLRTLEGFVEVVDPARDITPPVFGIASPASGALLSCKLALPAALSLAFSDEQSGVDAARVELKMDGGAVAPDTLTNTGLTYTLPQPLVDGAHTWSVTLFDTAGNGPAVFQSGFVSDSTPPAIVSFQPNRMPARDVELMDDDTLEHINFVLAENGSGIHWPTLSLRVQGVEKAPLAVTVGATVNLRRKCDGADGWTFAADGHPDSRVSGCPGSSIPRAD